jgi:hypothetical protein
MPADAVPGSTIPEDTEAEILLQDGTWAWAQVTGQRKDRHGRWCVGLRWYASPAVGGREGWYLYDPAFIRRPALRFRPHPESAGARQREIVEANGVLPPEVTRAGKSVCGSRMPSPAGRGLRKPRGGAAGQRPALGPGLAGFIPAY